jgi:hypothetical protein
MKSLICLRIQLLDKVRSLEILQTYFYERILIEFTRVHLKGTVAYFNTNIHWQMPLDVRGLMTNLFKREILRKNYLSACTGDIANCEHKEKYKWNFNKK